MRESHLHYSQLYFRLQTDLLTQFHSLYASLLDIIYVSDHNNNLNCHRRVENIQAT